MSKWQLRQGGSALVYALVAGGLVIVLVGGLYWLRQTDWTSESAKDTASESSKQDKETSDTPKKFSPDRSTSDKQQTTPPEGGKQSVPSEDGATPSKNTVDLPATGPADTLGQLLAVTLLTFAVSSYLLSSRTRWTSRDK